MPLASAAAPSAWHHSPRPTGTRSRLREADRYEDQANNAARDAASWSTKAARYGKEAADLQVKPARAEPAEQQAAERARQREQREAERRATAERKKVQGRLATNEKQVGTVLRQLREPKPEKLRVLMPGAASEGDLRVSREQAPIRTTVERALHRDLVELDVRPAATTDRPLDGLTRFRPHVVHFSGHSDTGPIVFEHDLDELHEGAVVTDRAFASAVKATDDPSPPVLLDSCHSAARIKNLVETVPSAIGMADEVGDGGAITYAARFYAAVADGQSVRAAHDLGRAAVELAGLPDHELPTLECPPDVDPSTTFPVKPPQ
ncbi:hypothetical protein ACFU5P_04355 [Streptomyces sp. NPDC057433]|uniref:hypothetical protein n=1 Tax=Streptomyces sp. NPDC057433 TaxID=3346132 RepID=UPI0036BDE09C